MAVEPETAITIEVAAVDKPRTDLPEGVKPVGSSDRDLRWLGISIVCLSTVVVVVGLIVAPLITLALQVVYVGVIVIADRAHRDGRHRGLRSARDRRQTPRHRSNRRSRVRLVS
jgi:hypothetical protein